MLNLIIIPPLRHFTILGHENTQNMTRYCTLEQAKNTVGKRSSRKWPDKINQTLTNNGGIINPLFDSLTYNTCRYFAHCSYYVTHKISARIIC